jgi:uncharacterized membrane protein
MLRELVLNEHPQFDSGEPADPYRSGEKRALLLVPIFISCFHALKAYHANTMSSRVATSVASGYTNTVKTFHEEEYPVVEYIVLASTAWFMGFFPLFEVYLAVPAAMLMGLDVVSSIVWASFGNFCAVPVVMLFYAQLERIQRVKQWFERMENSRYKPLVEKYGSYVVLLLTPVIGVWAIAVIAHGLRMKRSKLFLNTAISILIYAIITAVLTKLGVSFVN